MYARLMAVLTIACFLLSVPVISLADNHEEKGKAGGKAGEHRSENAEERSNAQWQEDANKGKKEGGDESTKNEGAKDKDEGEEKSE